MIRGDRIVLRPVEDADVPHIHRWMNSPDVWRNMDYERAFSLEDVRDDVERSRADGVPFTIEVDGRAIGRIGLNQFRRRDRIAAMYLYIGETEAGGHGYALEAIDVLLAFAFERFDLWQVELWTLADNEKAIHVYRKAGFVEEATLRQRSWKEGRWVDRMVMTVNRDEFEKARTARSGS
jgi:RimJ/RimL family protein N-acetyltransferase